MNKDYSYCSGVTCPIRQECRRYLPDPPDEPLWWIEKAELHERMTRLDKFIRSENFDNLDDEEQSLLLVQFGAMLSYLQVLKRRIAKAEN